MLLSITSDAQILPLVKNLDKQVIPAILAKYGDTLYGIAYHKLQTESLAANVIQQTFKKIWQQLSNFNEQEDRLFNWIVKIMNQVISQEYYEKVA